MRSGCMDAINLEERSYPAPRIYVSVCVSVCLSVHSFVRPSVCLEYKKT